MWSWQHQLLESPDLTGFAPVGSPFAGDNAFQEIEILGAPGARDFFQWQITRA